MAFSVAISHPPQIRPPQESPTTVGLSPSVYSEISRMFQTRQQNVTIGTNITSVLKSIHRLPVKPRINHKDCSCPWHITSSPQSHLPVLKIIISQAGTPATASGASLHHSIRISGCKHDSGVDCDTDRKPFAARLFQKQQHTHRIISVETSVTRHLKKPVARSAFAPI